MKYNQLFLCIAMLKIVELFGGIGSFRKALLNLNILYKITIYIERVLN